MEPAQLGLVETELSSELFRRGQAIAVAPLPVRGLGLLEVLDIQNTSAQAQENGQVEAGWGQGLSGGRFLA